MSCVVHAVSRTDIDLHFTDAIRKHAMLTLVAEGQSVDAYLDAQPCAFVAQGNEPILEHLGLPDLDHGVSGLRSWLDKL